MTSEKQAKANRRNAEKSTGPKTTAGKSRSAQNATSHGFYKVELEPISAGLLSEDPVEFANSCQELIEGLAPRDGLERQQARVLIAAYRRLERLDRFETAALTGDGQPSAIERSLRGDPDMTRRISQQASTLIKVLYSDLDETDGDEIVIEGDPDEGIPDKHVSWQSMARLIRMHGPDPKVGVKNLWSGELEPASPAEWREAFAALLRHHWPNRDDALEWAQYTWAKRSLEADELTIKEAALASMRSMQTTLDQASRLRERALKELTVALAVYAQLETRDLDRLEELDESA